MRVLARAAAAVGVGLCVSVGSATSEELAVHESVLRHASASLYSDVVMRACLNGRRYPRDLIENGFRRHFEEMKLVLLDRGYRIEADGSDDGAMVLLSQATLDGQSKFANARHGCHGVYWMSR